MEIMSVRGIMFRPEIDGGGLYMSNKKSLAVGILAGFLAACLCGGLFLSITGGLGREAASGADDASGHVLSSAAEKKLEQIYQLIDRYYLEDVDHDALVEGIYKGMVASLDDPYSVYYDLEEAEAVAESIGGTYSGIGATLTKNVETGGITVVRCFEGAPSVEGGLLPGDQIVSVDGTDVLNMDISEAVALIKGEEHTRVVLTVYREGETDYLDLSIERANIDIPTVEYEMLDQQIGYILVTNFEQVTTEQFDEAFRSLQSQGMQALVLDLRDNPGGILDVACDLCEYFMDQGLIVYTEDKYGSRIEYEAEDADRFGKPVAVLVNENSASASEIVAGALQDTDNAAIVGTTTFGKGIVQQFLNLGDGSALKLTFSKYYTPNGNNIHEVGIVPDVEVELDEVLRTKAVIEFSEDNQLQKALEVLQEQM